MRQFNFVSLLLLLGVLSCNTEKQEKIDLDEPLISNESYIGFEDSKSADPSWPGRNTVHYHTIGEPASLHPTNGSSAFRSEIFLYTQMSLMRLNYKSGVLIPGLITEMPAISDDQIRFSYQLRNDVIWDNSDPLSAEDILFTLKVNISPFTENPNIKPYLQNLKKLVLDEADDRKFIVIMNNLANSNLSFWTNFPILQKKYHDPDGILDGYDLETLIENPASLEEDNTLNKWFSNFNNARFGRDPQFLNGLGTYKLLSWDAGQEMILERKQNHWTEKTGDEQWTSFPKQIIFKIISDPNATILELKAQNIDVSAFLSPSAMEELQQDENFQKNYHSAFVPTYNYTFAAMNCKPDGERRKKIFDDRNVRIAVSLLTPVDQLNKIVASSKGIRMCGPVSPLKSDFNDALKPVPYNLDSANALLEMAGWIDSDDDGIRDKEINGVKQNLEFEIYHYNMSPLWGDMASMMALDYEKAGINVMLKALDYRALVENVSAHNFDMMLGTWGGSAEPEDFSQLWHSGSWSSGGFNYTGFGNELSDLLIDSINKSTDETERKKLSAKFQELVYNDQPYVFLLASVRRVAVHKRFNNIELYHERPGILLNKLKPINFSE